MTGYKSIYRVYRPETFDEVLGQDHIVKVLRSQIEGEKVSHAYLFCGTRGTGKTTTARLMAKAVNCLAESGRPCGVCENCIAVREGNFMDLVELDAASNNKVDDIRSLRDGVNYYPTVGKKKIYIIDEVHMLTKGAYNALLKTLEEPPAYVIFILATTEPEKLPATILSRCMRMDFRRVSEEILVSAIEKICGEAGIEADEDALRLIAGNADGSVRDCLTILEQCIAGLEQKLDRNEVLRTLGAVDETVYIRLTAAIIGRNIAQAMMIINEIIMEGKDARQVMYGWLQHYRRLLITKYVKDSENVLNISRENVERIKNQGDLISLSQITTGIRELAKTAGDGGSSTQPRILLEVCAVKLATDIGEIHTHQTGQMQQTRQAKLTNPSNEGDSRYMNPTGNRNESEENHETQNELKASEQLAQSTEPKELPEPQEDTREVDRETIGDRDENMDLHQVWRDVIILGNKKFGGAFTMVSNKAIPAGVSGNQVFICCQGIAVDYVEKNRESIEDMFHKVIGEKIVIRIVEDEGDVPGREGSEGRLVEDSSEEVSEAVRKTEEYFGKKVNLK